MFPTGGWAVSQVDVKIVLYVSRFTFKLQFHRNGEIIFGLISYLLEVEAIPEEVLLPVPLEAKTLVEFRSGIIKSGMLFGVTIRGREAKLVLLGAGTAGFADECELCELPENPDWGVEGVKGELGWL